MPNISAPYNFVPINKEVFFPDWAPFISHDIPFKKGLSGKIQLEITAESPIFIRGKEEDNQIDPKFKQYRFFKHNNTYCIPGSSLKGEISNILEILTFSKLKNHINDVKYSQREWLNESIYDKRRFAEVKGGWLSEIQEGYKIEYSTDKPGRISHKEIDTKLGTNLDKVFSIDKFVHSDENKSTKKKHDLLNAKQLMHLFSEAKNKTHLKSARVIFNEHGKKEGTLVFTGQASQRTVVKDKKTKETKLKSDGSPEMKGKHLEFVFWKPNEPIHLKSEDIRIKSFKTAYFDGTTSESIDWKYYKEKLKEGERIPVFITLNSQSEIEHFGLSMLYKLPYDKSTVDLLSESHKSTKMDFTESLFGTINETKQKGRVHFGHLFSDNGEEEKETPYTAVLANPKPSFYPFYIDQNVGRDTFIKSNYKTYNEGPLAGRKRYPIRNKVKRLLEDQKPTKTTTSFFPLKEKSIFKGVISFHNLLPVELGALLSALTFHKQGTEFKHSIGQGKPLGFGKSSIKIESIKIDETLLRDKDKEVFINNKLGLFEQIMVQNSSNWLQSKQIKELLAMAKPVSIKQEIDAHLDYLKMDVKNRENDFVKIKKGKKALPRYSKFMNLDITLNSLIVPNESVIVPNINTVINNFNINKSQVIASIKLRQEQLKGKINRANSNGIEERIKDLKKYPELIQIVNTYKKEMQIELLDANDSKALTNTLDIIYNTFNRKKKKLFVNQSKKNTVASWIGEEKALEWFNSKTQ